MSYWKLIKSRVAGKVPSINQVDEDTLALNQADGKLYVLRISGSTREVIPISGGEGLPGTPGADGREIELQTSATHIQWRYVGETTWLNLIALSAITGPAGDDGEDGAPGAPGADGVDGREIELQVTATHIQWRYVGSATWTNLVALSVITGPAGTDGDDGREIELQTSATHIQWRYVGDATWTNLIALSSLQGADGADGTDGREVELQTSRTHIQWRYTGGTWIDLIALSALKGDQGDPGADGDDGITPHIGANGNWYIGLTDTGIEATGPAGLPGDDGQEVELQANATHIQWRYVGALSWINLVALSTLEGPPGSDGADGTSTYYTTHTFAIRGYIFNGDYPGFIVDRIYRSSEYAENQRIVKVAARTTEGSLRFELHRKLQGSTSSAQLVPATGYFTADNNGEINDNLNFSLSHNYYVYLKVSYIIATALDLSVTVTIEHTPASGDIQVS
jgi:hypothetical protein